MANSANIARFDRPSSSRAVADEEEEDNLWGGEE